MSEDSLGEWILEELAETYFIERSGWAPERVSRVAKRIQRDRPEAQRLEGVVFFGGKETAFTAPGPYVFLSRRLVERFKTDAACAWVFAHEVAHHDLGHLAQVPSWMERYVRVRGAWVMATLANSVARRLLGPEQELEADRHAVELCLQAGYHPTDFLQAFDAVESLVKDIGSQEAILGPDIALWDAEDERTDTISRMRIWLWERAVGYLPFRERRSRIEEYLSSLDLSDYELIREAEAPRDIPAADPGVLPPEERGLFTSPPSTDVSAAEVHLRSGSWKAYLAPNDRIIYFDVDDDAHRMLAQWRDRRAKSFEDAVLESLPAVFRRWWWRAKDREFCLVESDGHAAVFSTLPRGPWHADITPRFCRRRPAGLNADALPWSRLAYATVEELDRMMDGQSVVVPDAAMGGDNDSS